MLTFSKLSKQFGPKTLFKDISLRIQSGERIGLVGPNGAGKTTLFSIILGNIESDSGKVELERGTVVGFLPQESAPTGEETVIQLATSISPELEIIYSALRAFPDSDSPEHVDALERFIELDGYTLEARAKRILAGLAFHADDFEKPAHTLSGGWIMRVHLARLLVMEPDLLMLDEPTNHLDLETLGWFQNQIKNYSGAVLVISHDRAFLNAICDGIVEIANGRLHRYHGNYDDYLRQKAEHESQQLAAYQNQQREIKQLETFINRFRAKASKAAQAQARIKQLEKIERIEPPQSAADTISFSFPQPQRSGQRVMTLENVRQAYGDHTVYKDLSLTIEKQQRIVLVGPNGAGKSTLLKILADKVPILSGSCTPGHNVSIGYFSQQRVDVLDVNRSVIEEATQRVNDGMNEEKVRGLLGAFLFKGDDVFKKVKVLSGGEKSRLALVKLLLAPPNLMLLDEPTTHLDMPSIDALIKALKDYAGTVVFVSHDVHFIRSIAQQTIHIQAGKIKIYSGDYDYYLRKSEATSEQSGLIAGLNNSRPYSKNKAKIKPPTATPKERRRLEAERRKLRASKRKTLEKQVAETEATILKLEEKQAQINEELANPDSYSDAEKAKDLNMESAKIAEQLKGKNQEWESAAEKLSQLVDVGS